MAKHIWKLDEFGEIDDFALDAGYHNGPKCTVCGFTFCQHCEPDAYESECPGHTPTLSEAIENITNWKINGMSEQEERSIPILLEAAKKWQKIHSHFWNVATEQEEKEE